MFWHGKEIKTLGESCEAIGAITTREEAQEFLHLSRLENPKYADENIGYLFGYFGRDKWRRLSELFGVLHPIFGDRYDLTDDEILKMGMELAMRDIYSWTPIRPGAVSIRDLAIQWFRSGDTGTSSETIFDTMTGVPVKRHGIPWDPSDFGRCYRLLTAFPEWKERMGEVSARFPEWKPFVDNWAKMEELYERDLPTDKSADLYNLMITLRGDSPHSRKVP